MTIPSRGGGSLWEVATDTESVAAIGPRSNPVNSGFRLRKSPAGSGILAPGSVQDGLVSGAEVDYSLALFDGVVQPELRELRRGRLARLGAPARHLVVRPPRREEFVRIDLLALQGAVADALVEPLGQHVVRRREALAAVEQARQRVVAPALLHPLVQAHGPAGDRVDVVDHRLELEPVERRAHEVAHP